MADAVRDTCRLVWAALRGSALILFTIVIHVAGVADLSAQLEYYTTIRRGAQVTISAALKKSGGVIMHVDTRSCVSCMISIRSVWKAADAQGLPTIVYAHAGSAREFEDLRTQFEGATVVDDELGAYAALHGVTKYPVLMVVDRTGTVRYVGAPGGTRTFDPEACMDAMQQVARDAGPAQDQTTSEVSVSTIATITSPDRAPLSPFSVMKVAPGSRSFVVLDPGRKVIYRFSAGGEIQTRVGLDTLLDGFNTYKPHLIAISEAGDSALISDSDALSATPVVYWLDLTAGKATIIQLPAMGRSRMTMNIGWDRETRSLWIARRPPHDTTDEDRDLHSLVRVDARGTEEKFGDFASDVLSMHCPSFYWACIDQTATFMVQLQSLSRRFTIHDHLGATIRTMTLEYPARHVVDVRDRVRTLTPSSTLEEVKRIADSSQTLYRMIGSRALDEVVVFSRTTANHYPELQRTRRGTHVVSVSRHDVLTGRCTGFWLLPEGLRPQDVDGTTLYATDFEGATQRIVAVELR